MDANTQNAQPQQYNLKWTNHTYNMLQTFSEQLSKENFVDCTIACEGQFLKVHKIILSGCSHYFQVSFFFKYAHILYLKLFIIAIV